MWPWGKKKEENEQEEAAKRERERPGWMNNAEEDTGPRAGRSTSNPLSAITATFSPPRKERPANDDGTWLNKLPFFNNSSDDDDSELGRATANPPGAVNDTRRPPSFMGKTFKNQSREEYEARQHNEQALQRQERKLKRDRPGVDYDDLDGAIPSYINLDELQRDPVEEQNKRDEYLFRAAEQVRKNKAQSSTSQLAQHLTAPTSSSIKPKFNTPAPTPDANNDNLHPEVRYAHHIKSRGTAAEEREQSRRERYNDNFFDKDGRFNPTKDITKRYMGAASPAGVDSAQKADLPITTTPPSVVDPRIQAYGGTIPMTPERKARLEQIEDEKYQDELAADEALWRQKERIRDKHLHDYAQQRGVDVDELRAQRRSNKSFHKFDVGPEKMNGRSLGEMFREDVEGEETSYKPGATYRGVPGRNSSSSSSQSSSSSSSSSPNTPNDNEPNPHDTLDILKRLQITQNHLTIPSNYVLEDNVITSVTPPQPISPAQYNSLNEENKRKYQQQQIDYQRWMFQHLTPRQQELMLIAQWDKLNEEQQRESLEFQYLHLDHNTRRKVKQFPSEEKKNSYLREQHFAQQRLFLTSPISYTNEQLEKELFAATRKNKSPAFRNNLKGKKKRLGADGKPRTYQDFINTGGLSDQDGTDKSGDDYSENDGDNEEEEEDDEDLYPENIRDMAPEERKQLVQDAVQRFNAFRRERYGEAGVPPDLQDVEEKEFLRMQKQFREMSPQQQFSFLFREHEKQRVELEKFHDQQLKRFTHQLMKKELEVNPDAMFTADALLRNEEIKTMRKQQQGERDILRKKQQDEHEQLTKVLLYKQQEEQFQQTQQQQQQQFFDENGNPKAPEEFQPQMHYIPNHGAFHEEEIRLMREKLYDELNDKKLLRDKLSLQWDLDEELQMELGMTDEMLAKLDDAYDEVIREVGDDYLEWKSEEEFQKDLDKFKKQLDRFRPPNTPAPISIEDARRIIVKKQRERRFNRREELEQMEMAKHLDRLRERRENMLLSLPINNELVKLHHPVVRDRLTNPIAAKIYKLTSMFLFGVNVRWNDGVVNGMFSKLTPPIPAELLQKERQRDPTITANELLRRLGFKPIYLDIEHRRLNFNNLVNYYGVAASIYDSDVMPIDSHRLYEDPDLNPFDHPNIAPLERYELLLEVQRRAKLFKMNTTTDMLDKSEEIDQTLPDLDGNGPLGEGVGDVSNAEERDVTKLKTRELLSIVSELHNPRRDQNNNNSSADDNNTSTHQNDINPMLFTHNDSIEVIKDTITKPENKDKAKTPAMLSDDPEAMRKAVIEYQERLKQQLQADAETNQGLMDGPNTFEVEKMNAYLKQQGYNWVADQRHTEQRKQRQVEDAEAKAREERRVMEAVVEEQERVQERQRQREAVKKRKEEILSKRAGGGQSGGTLMGGTGFDMQPVASNRDAVFWDEQQFSRNLSQQQKQHTQNRSFRQDYADWDGQDVGYASTAQAQAPQYKRRNQPAQPISHNPADPNYSSQHGFHHAPHHQTDDEDDNHDMVRAYNQRTKYQQEMKQQHNKSFGSWDDTITEVEDNAHGFGAETNKYLTYTKPGKAGKDGPRAVVPLLNVNDMRGRYANDTDGESSGGEDQPGRFSKSEYDPNVMISDRGKAFSFDKSVLGQQQKQQPNSTSSSSSSAESPPKPTTGGGGWLSGLFG